MLMAAAPTESVLLAGAAGSGWRNQCLGCRQGRHYSGLSGVFGDDPIGDRDNTVHRSGQRVRPVEVAQQRKVIGVLLYPGLGPLEQANGIGLLTFRGCRGDLGKKSVSALVESVAYIVSSASTAHLKSLRKRQALLFRSYRSALYGIELEAFVGHLTRSLRMA